MDNEKRKLWDPNVIVNKEIKRLGEDVVIVYTKTKKIAVVSSRDMFNLFHLRMVEGEKSKSGKPEMFITCKSREFPEF